MNVPFDDEVTPYEPLAYTFGWNNQQLYTASKKFMEKQNVSTPEDILFRVGDENLKIRLISTGGSHTLIYSENRKLYSFGRNFYGQLGHGNTEDTITLKEVDLSIVEDDEIISLDCGDRHSAFVTKKGRVFVFGSNGNGQLGVGQQNIVTSPQQVKLLMNKRIAKVVCGSRHTIFVTKSGSMFATGMGTFGQLGNGENKDVLFPVTVEKDQWKVIDIQAKEYQNIALSDDYSVYIWGGQAFKEGRDRGSSEAANVPRKICQNVLGRRVVEIASSSTFFELLTSDGSVFLFGYNFSKSGYLKFVPNILKVTKQFPDVEEQDKHLTETERSWREKLNLTSKYIITSDLCNDITFYRLQFLPSDDKVMKISVGESVSYYVTESGKIWVMGESKFHEIGLGADQLDAIIPTQVTALNDAFVPYVAAGNWHAFALTGSYKNFKSRHLYHGQQLPKSIERMEERIKELN